MVHCPKSSLVLTGRTGHYVRLTLFQALLLLVLLICPPVKAQTAEAQNASNPDGVPVVQENPAAQLLEPDKLVEREIAPGEKHSYSLRFEAGQSAQVHLRQLGSNVGVYLFGISGRLILGLNNIDDAEGDERLPVLAELAGIYRLEVRSLGRRTETGRYEMKVSKPRVATQQDKDYMAAELLLQQARQFVRQGTGQSKRNAIGKYKEALPLLRSSGNREREATVLSNIGVFYRSLGELSNSLNSHNQALAVRRQIGDGRGEAISLDHIGYVHVALGEPEKGLDFYKRALALQQLTKNQRGEANTLSNIGELYFELGETERALDFYNRSLPLYRAIGGRPREALALTRVGSVYFSRAEYQKALEYYGRALALQQTLNIRSALAETRQQIGVLYAKLGEKEKAFDSLNQALEFVRKIGNRYREAEALTIIGEVYFETGEKEKALEHFTQALPLRRESGDLQGEARTLYWLALSERDRGHLTEALAGIESALKILENVRGRIASQELRVSYFSTVQKYYDFYINLLFELHQKDPSRGYEGAALHTSERARARVLIELLREAHADIRRGVDPNLLERGRSLRQQLNARAEDQLLLLASEHTNDQARKMAQELNALASEYEDVETEIRKTSPRYAALTQPRALSLKEIQQLLDQETLLLEYKLGESRSFVWAVTPTTINIYELPPRVEVEKAARFLYELLTARNQRPKAETIPQRDARLAHAEEEYAKAAAHLSRMLLAPVHSHLKGQRLFIVSDGALQYVPFAALPKPATVSTQLPIGERSDATALVNHRPTPSVVPPLIADHEIISLPSASVIAVLREERVGRKPAAKTIAVFADPVFDRNDTRVTRRGLIQPRVSTANQLSSRDVSADSALLPARDRGTRNAGVTAKGEWRLARLPFSRREAEAILSAAPAEARMGAFNFQASRATALSPELAQYRILHFATHSLLDNERPELTAIVLSLVDERGRPQNGFIRSNEIYNLSLPADLVMLSACQTGLGKEIRGEGLIGLTRGFMYAGAARVGTSLWKVDDAATAALMGRFYDAMLKEGKSPSAALKVAQTDLMKQRRWQSPYFWAAFILQGEWK